MRRQPGSASICALCHRKSELRDSHVIPSFFGAYLKETSATGYLRSGLAPNLRLQGLATADWHTYQVLTKRSERMRDMLRTHLRFAANKENIWWGVSVEDRRYGLPRIDHLRQAPAKVRFLSIEPLLADLGDIDLTGISWVIVGGESGPGARPMRRDWVVSIRKQCREQRVPFFFKQWGGVRKAKSGRLLDNRTYDEYPSRTAAPVPEKLKCAAFADELLRGFEDLMRPNQLVPLST